MFLGYACVEYSLVHRDVARRSHFAYFSPRVQEVLPHKVREGMKTRRKKIMEKRRTRQVKRTRKVSKKKVKRETKKVMRKGKKAWDMGCVDKLTWGSGGEQESGDVKQEAARVKKEYREALQRAQHCRLKRIEYVCTQWCGGWGDRLAGLVSSFALALFTRSDFGVQWAKPEVSEWVLWRC